VESQDPSPLTTPLAGSVLFLFARRYASTARAMILCLSVRLKSVFYLAGRSSCIWPTLGCKEIRVSTERRMFPSGNLSETVDRL